MTVNVGDMKSQKELQRASSYGSSAVLRPKEKVLPWLLGPLIAGALLGAVVPLDIEEGGEESRTWARVSAQVGWSYFFAWSISFYPQIVQNFRRRSVVGLSLDFQMLNLAGFCCYFLFNVVLYCSPHVQQEYRDEHGGQSIAVRLNDVVFAGHALAVTLLTLLQIAFFYDYPPLDFADLLLRRCVILFMMVLLAGAIGVAVFIVASSENTITWLEYLIGLSEVKVMISVFKYCPQVWMNFRRKSTDGWNIVNVLLDFFGGSLSVGQLVMDAWISQDWGAVFGNPAKFCLGNLSMLFDTIFIIQHYVLYREISMERTASDV